MGLGNSWASNVAVVEQVQSTQHTAGTPSIWVPRVSETLRAARAITESAAGYGTRSVKKQCAGIRSAAGQVQMELMPIALGWWLKWLFFDVTSAAAATPSSLTGTPANGGSRTAGTYFYKVAPVYTHTLSGEKHVFNTTATSAGVTTETTNLTVNLAWSAPASAPRGYNSTVTGYVIYIGTDGGAASTCAFLAYQAGATTTYSDTGSASRNANITPIATTYDHTFTVVAPTSGTTAMRYFSLLKNQDLGSAVGELFIGCALGKGTIASGNDPNRPITAAFDVETLDYEEANEGSPSLTVENPVMVWQGLASIDGTLTSKLEQWSVELNNGLTRIPWTRGLPYSRGFSPGQQRVTGTFTLGAEDHAEWTKMRGATQFAMNINCDGDYITSAAAVTASTVYAPKYGLMIELPEAFYTAAGGNQSGEARMLEALPFVTEAETNGWPTRFTLRNATASYPNAA